ncbi:hypothetical protein BT96DRAFT_858776 [Gymnopus androsaceus JB14]|uniref:DUF7918 domain-containing protein n=1 Tax=Gymnopus androsaceus JB14 TaxID=1447944 RepID=A0A6A4HJB0_9AGAR|nr:hypothetical protein BT96DRAFT_858776 [Gymnopus androsaceus JB14]
MPTFQSFSASIVIDGKPLDEYNVETSEADGITTVTCWIPSFAGKKYEVHWKDSICEKASKGRLYVDGTKCGSRVIEKRYRVAKKRGIRVSPTTLRPFEFFRLNLTDSDTSEMPCNVGQIELRLKYWLVDVNHPKKPKSFATRGLSIPTEQVFNEKAKKGIDHHTKFGDVVQVKPWHSGRPGKSDGDYFLHFRFRYRPLDVLRAHGIAPPAEPTASGSSSPRPMKRRRNSTEEDVKPISEEIIEVSDDEDPQTEIERLQARIEKLKAKRPGDNKRVKRESNVKREPELSSSGPVFIDST